MSFLEAFEVQSVWEKGHPIPGYDPAVWRRDDHGAAIRRTDYGDRDSEYGWEIDHTTPTALGGSDTLANKRPLHWHTNASGGGLLGALKSGRKTG